MGQVECRERERERQRHRQRQVQAQVQVQVRIYRKGRSCSSSRAARRVGLQVSKGKRAYAALGVGHRLSSIFGTKGSRRWVVQVLRRKRGFSFFERVYNRFNLE